MTTLARRLKASAIAFAAGCGLFAATPLLGAEAASIIVQDPWVREPLGERKDTAAFAVVENRGSANRALVSASTDAAEKVELHEMKMVDAMMRMSPVARIDIPAGGKVELKPGGLHVMLFGFKKPARAGDSIDLTLTFDDGSKVTVKAAVRRQEGMR